MHALTRMLLWALLTDADELAAIGVPARYARISLADDRLPGWRTLSPDELREVAGELIDLAVASEGALVVQVRPNGTGTVSIEIGRRAWLARTWCPPKTPEIPWPHAA